MSAKGIGDTPKTRLRGWFLADITEQPASHQGPYRKVATEEQKHPWWKVMCLTGVDYFSTLGYQPGIAALAAGVLSPMATIVLVALTLFGALPVYRRVARESPHGEGSIAMLAKLLPKWRGKIFVLVLLGFAATDFIITMTLSAADGAAHLIENPFAPDSFHDKNLIITLILLALLAAVFLKGFTEAIGIAVALVAVFLALNLVVVIVGLYEVFTADGLILDWTTAMTTEHGSIWMMIGISLLVFPKLALGLSGFETGVAVMPQIEGDAGDTEKEPTGRIRGARNLLLASALIMSSFLIASSFITTILIPEDDFKAGGPANGRALAYLAHEHLGEIFGTVYDVSTIAILWFAGASAMAGLLNLVPRYLPRFGMAPEWGRAVRPLVVVFAVVAFGITWYFDASVDAQGAAYATGVLVLITSAAVAVTLSAARKGESRKAIGFGVVAAVFLYTTVANIFERPEGLQIAMLFILAIVVTSFASRILRSFELRAIDVQFDEAACRLLTEAAEFGQIRIVCHDAYRLDMEEYRLKEAHQRKDSRIPGSEPVIFFEVKVVDASEFSAHLHVRGCQEGENRILRVDGAVIPNTVAAVLLQIRDEWKTLPHVYFEWTEGNPVTNLLKFLFVGEGEVAPVTREVLRRAEPDVARRPHVHVDS